MSGWSGRHHAPTFLFVIKIPSLHEVCLKLETFEVDEPIVMASFCPQEIDGI